MNTKLQFLVFTCEICTTNILFPVQFQINIFVIFSIHLNNHNKQSTEYFDFQAKFRKKIYNIFSDDLLSTIAHPYKLS